MNASSEAAKTTKSSSCHSREHLARTTCASTRGTARPTGNSHCIATCRRLAWTLSLAHRSLHAQINGDRYYGTFFKSPIGQSFTGDVDLTNDTADAIRGKVHMGGLKLVNSMTGH
jgi:hypothetical protein